MVHASGGLVMAEVDNVCFAIWRTKPDRALFEIQKRCLASTVLRFKGACAFLCVVEQASEPPDDDIRKESSEMITAHGTNITAVALVIEGTGFRAAITRTVLSGIVLVIRTPAPIRYFESPRIAADWLRTKMPSLARDLPQEVEAARRHSDGPQRSVWPPAAR